MKPSKEGFTNAKRRKVGITTNFPPFVVVLCCGELYQVLDEVLAIAWEIVDDWDFNHCVATWLLLH